MVILLLVEDKNMGNILEDIRQAITVSFREIKRATG
jgi:hypothetical protein